MDHRHQPDLSTRPILRDAARRRWSIPVRRLDPRAFRPARAGASIRSIWLSLSGERPKLAAMIRRA